MSRALASLALRAARAGVASASAGRFAPAVLGLSQSSVAVRSIWSSPPALNLVEVLKQEVAHEKTNYQVPEVVKAGAPAPFKLTQVDGDTLLTLSREYKGEQISVDLHVNNQPAAPEVVDGDDGESISTVAFNVAVVKGDKALVYECESDGSYVIINHVSHEPKEGVASESAYTGPVFEELDENLQRELRLYLEERGITAELGEFLRHAIYDKEQREYMGWLQKVQDFVQSK